MADAGEPEEPEELPIQVELSDPRLKWLIEKTCVSLGCEPGDFDALLEDETTNNLIASFLEGGACNRTEYVLGLLVNCS